MGKTAARWVRRVGKQPAALAGGGVRAAGGERTLQDRAVLERIVEQYRCPITKQLLVDPVVAEDGHFYEREALMRWLATRKGAGAPMGTVMGVPGLRQTLDDLVSVGLLNDGESHQFFLARGQERALRTGQVRPDFDGATQDLGRARKFARTEQERTSVELHTEAVAFLKRGSALFAHAEEVKDAEFQGSDGEAVRQWALRMCEVAQALASKHLGSLPAMKQWQNLPEGRRVRVVGTLAEVRRLCERPAPGSRCAVKWNEDMQHFVGRSCVVQKSNASQKSYVLRLEEDPRDRTFLFPFTVLALID